MRLFSALALSALVALLSACEGHEHAHRHHQHVARKNRRDPDDHERRQFFSFNFDFPFQVTTTKSTTKSTTTSVRTSSKTPTTTSRTPTTTSSRTPTTTSKTPTTTSKTPTTTSKTPTTTARTTSSTTLSTTKAAQTSQTSSSKSSTASASIDSKASSSVSTSQSQKAAATPAVRYSNSTTNSTTSGASVTVGSTILVLARDQNGLNQATAGLNGYGIPFQTLIVPQSGTSLPTLNTSAGGNFGGIVIASGLVYYYDAEKDYRSALTDDQWNQLYAYQLAYGVRMVQYDVYPSSDYGVSAVGGCCDAGVEQLVSFTNNTAFKQAGVRLGAGMSTEGMYHYLAQVADASTTTEIAQFAANSQFNSPSTAGVINNFNGREQMVFFIAWATSWSSTSAFLQHAYITWMTRGLYAGYRRVHLATQIDDVMLRTQIYYPNNSTTYYRLNTDDMESIKSWTQSVNDKINQKNPGSWYRVELGHNGNGNIIYAFPNDTSGACGTGPIYTKYTATTLEFQKPLGSGTDGWPTTATNYSFTQDCLKQDPMYGWMSNSTNGGMFLHVSHTFTHEGQNNATYNDIYKEINWNQQWFKQSGIAAFNYSGDSLIPPQITGTHNGDALQAWADNGLTNCVGDNSRPLLRNQNNDMWPYTTTVADNGFAGMTIVPRWAGRIYYNCDTPDCTTQEWKDLGGGSGNFTALMSDEVDDATRYLLGLYHDGFMFHQLNLRNQNMTALTTPDGTKVNSLLQNWVENVVQEFTRLVNWPIITLKQSDLAVSYRNRQARDGCGYQMSYNLSGGKIVGVTVSSSSNTCAAAIPVTFPGPVDDAKGFATEQVGNDPLTIWVKLTGQPVTFTLTQSI